MNTILLLASLAVSSVQAADAPAAAPKPAKTAKAAKTAKTKDRNSPTCVKLQQRWDGPKPNMRDSHDIWALWVANCPGTPDMPAVPVKADPIPTATEKRCGELDAMLSGADAMLRDGHLNERKKLGCGGTPPKGKDY